MKKYLLLVFLAIFAVSCSKKVEVKGKITGGSPLERIEFIEASGVATLPLTNIGVKPDGTFSGSFEAPKDGMYVLSYAGKENLIYMKQGQSINISGKAENFPMEMAITGDAQANNDFLKQTQKYLVDYSAKLNLQEKFGKDETSFLKDIQKIQSDLEKNIDETGKKLNADAKVIEWKKNDVRTGILSLLPQYEMYRKQVSANPSFSLSKALKDYENSLQKDKDLLVKDHPLYRKYLLTKMTEDFQKFASAESKGKTDVTTSEMFSKFLVNKKGLSQTAKDYLLAFVIAQSDLHPQISKESDAKITKIINEDIKDATVKADLKKVQSTIVTSVGSEIPDAALMKADGKSYKISEAKGKPQVVMFYSSWSPYIAESTVPVLKEVNNFFKSKVNFTFVNFDDTKDQFIKTSNSLLKGISGTNVYADGGLNSDFAKKLNVYGFKLAPSYLVLDKDGKIAGRAFFNLGDPEFISLMEKLSGLKAPQVAPEATLQNDLLAPQNQNPQNVKAGPQPQPQPASK